MPSSTLSAESKSSETKHQPFNAIGIFSFFSTILALLGLAVSVFSFYQLVLVAETLNIASLIQTIIILLVSCCWAFSRVLVGFANTISNRRLV